jgi:hypothetical protein
MMNGVDRGDKGGVEMAHPSVDGVLDQRPAQQAGAEAYKSNHHHHNITIY